MSGKDDSPTRTSVRPTHPPSCRKDLLQRPLPARVSAVAADVVDAHGLGARAEEVAARQRSPQTRRTYAAVHRSLVAFLGEHATVEDLTPEAVRAYRDALEHADRTHATIAKHALSHEEFARLLKVPDRRTRQGKRDLALLHLLGSAGLRRSAAAALELGDGDERLRAADPRLRHAIKGSMSWWVIVRYAKRGRTRVVPLDDDALEAIVSWVKSRPPAATEYLLLSMSRGGAPGPLARATSHGSSADTPRRPTCPTTAAPRTCCATRSARISPTGARTPPSSASSPATPTSGPRPSTPPSAPRASSTPSTSASDNGAPRRELRGRPSSNSPVLGDPCHTRQLRSPHSRSHSRSRRSGGCMPDADH